MNPEHQIKAGNGSYTPSDRANKAVSASKAHMGGRFGTPYVGEGMHEGNSIPNNEDKTNTKPAKGATPPDSKNQVAPGVGADNSAVKRSGKI